MRGGCRGRPRHRRRLGELTATGAVAAAAQQNEIIANHFGRISLLAILIFPTSSLQTTFNVNLLAFEQIVGDILGAP